MSIRLAPLCGAAELAAVALPRPAAAATPGGGKHLPPMAFAYHRNVPTEDPRVLVAYLRSLGPISNAVK